MADCCLLVISAVHVIRDTLKYTIQITYQKEVLVIWRVNQLHMISNMNISKWNPLF